MSVTHQIDKLGATMVSASCESTMSDTQISQHYTGAKGEEYVPPADGQRVATGVCDQLWVFQAMAQAD
jgi:hypothetical protein